MSGWLSTLLLLGGAGCAVAQTTLPPATSTTERPGVACPVADIPQLLLPYTPLPPLTDSAYLVSVARYRFYQQLHRHALDTTARTADSLIASYAQSLRETQQAYDTLLGQYLTSNEHAAQTLRSTQLGLGQLGRTLDQTQYALAQTAHRLEEAKAQTQAARRRSLMQRLAFGAGGVGAGLILGLLLQ